MDLLKKWSVQLIEKILNTPNIGLFNDFLAISTTSRHKRFKPKKMCTPSNHFQNNSYTSQQNRELISQNGRCFKYLSENRSSSTNSSSNLSWIPRLTNDLVDSFRHGGIPYFPLQKSHFRYGGTKNNSLFIIIFLISSKLFLTST